MRICSLLPGATEVVAGLGLADDLVAISHECDYPPEIRNKPVVIQSLVNPEETSSLGIDQQVGSALRQGSGLYRINVDLLREAHPTLIITQDLCEVCAVTPTEVHRALAGLPHLPQILSLNPTGIYDVFHDIEMIGLAIGRQEAARRWVGELTQRLEKVKARVAAEPRRSVGCIEWLEPLYRAGHWVPELVSLAGGTDVLAGPEAKSVVVAWELVQAAAPDVLILMPCGFSIDRTLKEIDRLTSRPGWKNLPAVMNSEVYVVDGPAYFNRPGPRLLDGLELLARLLHPTCFDGPLPAGAHRLL